MAINSKHLSKVGLLALASLFYIFHPITPEPASALSLSPLEIGVSDRALLWALNQVEASGQSQVTPRFEKGFYHRYLEHNPSYHQLKKKHGTKSIASSYGPWQIMFPTAVQMGYDGPPEALNDAMVSLPLVLKYLRWLGKQFDQDLALIVSAYNAGPGGVGSNPAYTRRVLDLLKQAPESWKVFGT